MKRVCFVVVFMIVMFFTYNVQASSIDYELKIDKDRHFYETITYKIENNTTNVHLLNILKDDVYFDLDNQNLYNKNISNNGMISTIVLKYDYDSGYIRQSKFLNECFKSYSYEEDKYGIVYYATSPFKCFNRADKISITVTTDINAIINTADEVIRNKYIWNKINKDFSMDLSLGKYSPNTDVLPPIADDETVPSDDMDEWPVENIREFSYTRVIVIGIAAMIIIIGIILYKKKRSSRNGYNTDFNQF